jgi:DNA helicase II / ATP-dependent DNA helicase PcrA
VGMTRAEKRLYLTWARYRRRFGGGQPEATLRSRFLAEVPPALCERVTPFRDISVNEVDLFSEQYDVRESVKKNMYNGRTYNSLDNIAQFFAERGMAVPSGIEKAQQSPRPQASAGSPISPAPPARSPFPPPPPPSKPAAPPTLPQRSVSPAMGARPAAPPSAAAPASAPIARPAPKPRKTGGGAKAGSTIHHPKYGRGTVLRREGEGEDAKLTISFPGFGLKKIVEKFAGIQTEE